MQDITGKPPRRLVSGAFIPGAVAAWAIALTAVSVMVARVPADHTVTHIYREASRQWFAGESIYSDPSGYNYLPHFAILFTPFNALPSPVNDIAWRWVSAGLLAWGMWRVVARFPSRDRGRMFFLATLFALPLCLGAIRNGQANAMFSAVTVHAVASLMNRQFWRAAGLLALATAIKPLGLVLLLLAPVLYPPVAWRAGVAVAGLVVFPFLFAAPHYVMEQLAAAMANLRQASEIPDPRFADLNGIFRALHMPLTGAASKLMRLGVGAAALALCWSGRRRLAEPLRALFLLALATGYLMLCNPMNEVNSYVIFAPAIALLTMYYLDVSRNRGSGFALVALTLGMGFMPELMSHAWKNFGLWFLPAATVACLTVIAAQVFISSTRMPRRDHAPQRSVA